MSLNAYTSTVLPFPGISASATTTSSTVFDRHDLRVLREAYERARHGIEEAGIADEDARSDLAKLLFGTGRDLMRAGGGLKAEDAADVLARSASRAMVELKGLPAFA